MNRTEENNEFILHYMIDCGCDAEEAASYISSFTDEAYTETYNSARAHFSTKAYEKALFSPKWKCVQEWGLEEEVRDCMLNGDMSFAEACEEWDIPFPED